MSDTTEQKHGKLIIAGNPNVGKSVLFGALTGRYATVSNYPGTTVEVLRGPLHIGNTEYEVVDTPGMYSIFPVTEEERVARRILFAERADAVVHVADAKNLERMLPLTLQLIEAGLPVVLVLNIMDEAEAEGISIDIPQLEAKLGIPVVGAAFARGRGIDELKKRIASYTPPATGHIAAVDYPATVEDAIKAAAPTLPPGFLPNLSRRTAALLMAAMDQELLDDLNKASPTAGAAMRKIAEGLADINPAEPVAYRVVVRQREMTRAIADSVVTTSNARIGFRERLSRTMMNPLTGFPILAMVLYFGLYKFVGGFGAGTLVDFIEGSLFEKYANPFFTTLFNNLIPWTALRELFTGEYGMITLGLRYAFAIILPIVTVFFVVFAVIEDSGYLPRLAMLIDNIFKRIGLSGRAVIPMVLGLGCATMATLVTRTLPTKKERVLATMLLALAVPCSAQLGVILALLEDKPAVIMVWSTVMLAVFLAAGYLGARLIPGAPASFFMELPPLRVPGILNVMTKTFVRVKWYLQEVVPLFLLASLLLWAGKMTGVFGLLEKAFRAPVVMAGLPPECAKVFIFGFLRRDYGAAGLYDLSKEGLLTNVQVAVACVALTLFLPCIAQFLVNIRERGLKTGLAISALTVVMAFTVAAGLNALLLATGATL
ncbi:MAG: ferrous iron transport protein B [bacterium]